MNFIKRQVNFTEVVAGDSFECTLKLPAAYQMTPETSITMRVSTYSDIPQAPILVFSTGTGSITISGQKFTLSKTAEEMKVRPGKYQYECEFTTGSKVDTLLGGIFEVISKSIQPTN